MNRTVSARIIVGAMVCAIAIAASQTAASAFCGFYVGKADTGLFNHASQVAYVRDGDHTVLSIMNDYQGEPSDFALVVPVPVVLQKDQIHIGERELFSHLDSYSSPRLVEYNDPSPCPMPPSPMAREIPGAAAAGTQMGFMSASHSTMAKALGVTIQAQYTVGEYDIEMLSATQSSGLETYLIEAGYKVPAGVSRALQPYIRQNMKFFVAKVNLTAHERTGLEYLRPIQFAFDSPKFMLPIRLGMINAKGPQDLIIYMLTRQGRVETTNYRTVKVPTGMDLPSYIQDDLGGFYKTMFSHQVAQNDSRAVFTEYVWNLGMFCDPCAAPPLSSDELRRLGVFWIDGGTQQQANRSIYPGGAYEGQGPGQVMITRLHVRYSADTFPEDLMFQETGDTENFQARYVLRHPWAGSPDACPEAKSYFEGVRKRRGLEAETLADMTGWKINDIYSKAGYDSSGVPKPAAWWSHLWDY